MILLKMVQDINQKQEKFYLNFNMNTNPFHRLHTILSMAFKKDTVIKPANISKTEYLDDLGKYRYIICPLGTDLILIEFGKQFIQIVLE